ncbi:AbrB family transcriptional regulator [Patulibacter minatonensis]|uniref:AbrB family transcriptional regulator n=1 Tax=Patulibacter minatonensis TaxID=298163 RepID=UPI000686F685|nr:AbrB family transcriptional regulator [Patulibacter minatonensis]
MPRPSPTDPAVRRWTAVAVASAAGGFAAAAVGVPSPALFAGLLVGLAFALRTTWSLDVPPLGARAAQGVLGVSLGILVQSSTLSEIGRNAAPILGVTVATLAATIAAAWR